MPEQLIFIPASFGKAFDDATPAFTDKSDDLISFIARRQLFLYVFKRLGSIHVLVIDAAVNIEDMVDAFYAEPSSFEADRVNAGIAERVSSGLDKGGHVFAYQGAAADKSMLPEVYELVNGAHAADDGIIANHHMTGHLGIVTENTVIANNAVVRNVAVSHDQAVVSHLCGPTVAAAAVNGHKFTDGRIVSNLYRGFFAFIFQVLGDGRYYSAWKDPAVPAYPGAFHNGNVAADPGAFAYFNIVVDNGKRVYFNVCRQLGIGMNICMRMNHIIFFFPSQPGNVSFAGPKRDFAVTAFLSFITLSIML
jgi:hypothetical protein